MGLPVAAWICILYTLLVFMTSTISITEPLKIEGKNYYEILECTIKCSLQELKKNYREIALKFHPDKISVNSTEEEREIYKVYFLYVQAAYETLSDEERRLKYDLSLQNIEYDILKPEELDRYMSRPFALYLKSKRGRVKMHFQAFFEPPVVHDLNINVDIDISKLSEEQLVNKKYYRRNLCPSCKGNGGLDGTCRQCTLCEGKGFTLHKFERKEFTQFVETRCGSCKGVGCHPQGKCTTCNGEGTVMEEVQLDFVIPAWAYSGYNVFIPHIGHMTKDGRQGGVKVFAFYKFPESWSLNTRGNLEHELHVDLKTFVQGFEQIVIFPWGEDIKITVTPGTPIVSIMRGLSIVGAGMGVGLSTGQRGDAEVVVKWTLGRENVTDIEFMEVMEESGFYDDDFMYNYLLGVLFPSQHHMFDGLDVRKNDVDPGISVAESPMSEEDKTSSFKPGFFERFFGWKSWSATASDDDDNNKNGDADSSRADNINDESIKVEL